MKERLAALHVELSRAQAVDPQSRELLLALLSDITRLIGKPGSEAEQQSMAERLEGVAGQFEAGHPALGQAIRQVVDTLGKAGI